MTYADPWMLQGLMGRDAFGRVDGQHLVDEVFGFRSDGVPFRGWKLQEEVCTGKAEAPPQAEATKRKGDPGRGSPHPPHGRTHVIGPSLDLLV